MKSWTDIFAAMALAVGLSLNWGCAGFTPGDHPNFWTQCVKMDGYGFTMATAYGPFNLGKLTWERNVACEKDVKQQRPLIPPMATIP